MTEEEATTKQCVSILSTTFHVVSNHGLSTTIMTPPYIVLHAANNHIPYSHVNPNLFIQNCHSQTHRNVQQGNAHTFFCLGKCGRRFSISGPSIYDEVKGESVNSSVRQPACPLHPFRDVPRTRSCTVLRLQLYCNTVQLSY